MMEIMVSPGMDGVKLRSDLHMILFFSAETETLSLCQLLILVPIQPASRALADATGDGQFLV